VPGAPLWLNEGLAEYFSTMKVDADEVVVGDYLSNFTFTANSWGASRVDGESYLGVIALLVPKSELSIDNPAYRLTAFRHKGDYGMNPPYDW